jgi:hypothetical protein
MITGILGVRSPGLVLQTPVIGLWCLTVTEPSVTAHMCLLSLTGGTQFVTVNQSFTFLWPEHFFSIVILREKKV